jgi:hypothetical protein
MANVDIQNYNGTPLAPTPPNLPNAPTTYDQATESRILNVLRLYFNQLNNYIQALGTPKYGLKSQRPLTNQQIGQFYFDTTLGYPVWWNGSKWVNYNGTAV